MKTAQPPGEARRFCSPHSARWCALVAITMADSVQYALDRMVVDLEDLRYRGIFSEVRERAPEGARSNLRPCGDQRTRGGEAPSVLLYLSWVQTLSWLFTSTQMMCWCWCSNETNLSCHLWQSIDGMGTATTCLSLSRAFPLLLHSRFY